MYQVILKYHRLTFQRIVGILLLCVFAGSLIYPSLAHATIYQPGETLEPDCAPGSEDCGVATTTAVTVGGTGITSYTVGDLLYASDAYTLTKLNIGIEGKSLKVASGTLAWGDDIDTNIGNSNLTLSGVRTLTMNGNALTFAGGADIVFGNDGNLILGGGNLHTTASSTTLFNTAAALSIGGATTSINFGANLRIRDLNGQAQDFGSVIIGEGAGVYPDAVARDQLYVFGRINSSWNMYRQDFMSFDREVAVTTDVTGYVLDAVFNEATGNSGSFAVVSAGGTSGIARLNNPTSPSAGENEWFGTGGINVTERTMNPIFEARVQATTNTDHRVLVGFADLAYDAPYAADTNQASNEVMFRKDAAAANWDAVTRSAAGSEMVTNLAIGTGAMHILRIEIDNTNTEVRFYADGALVATHTTNLPVPSARMGWYVGNAISSNVDRATLIDYVRIWSDDPTANHDVEVVDLPPITFNHEPGLTLLNEVNMETPPGPFEYLRNQIIEDWQAIKEIIAVRIVAIRGYFEELFSKKSHQEELCIGTIDNETCLNKTQIDSIIKLIPVTSNDVHKDTSSPDQPVIELPTNENPSVPSDDNSSAESPVSITPESNL